MDEDVGSDFELEPLIDLSTPSTALRLEITSPSSSLKSGVTPSNTNLDNWEREPSSAQPSTSSGQQSIDSKIASLCTLFPNAKQCNTCSNEL